MAKTIEQVEGIEDLSLLIRGDRVKLADVDYKGINSNIYEVAFLSNQEGFIEFIMPHPNSPTDTIRRYRTRASKVTFDKNEKAFCVHETKVAIENYPVEHHSHNYWTKNRERIETLQMAGFKI